LKILITGGMGFIGKALTRNLRNRYPNARITIVDSMNPQVHGVSQTWTRQSGVEFYQCKISEINQEIYADIDYIYHLAAETGTAQSSYQIENYVQTNELEFASLLQGVANQAKSIKKIILPSSRSIYGEGAYLDNSGTRVFPGTRSPSNMAANVFDLHYNDEKLTPCATKETDKISCSSVYAATKFNQEILLKAFCATYDVRYTIFRLQNVYGPGQSLKNPYTGIVSIFSNLLRQNLPLNIFEDGNESRDFVYIEDVAQILAMSMCHSDSDDLTVNLGTGQQVSVMTIAKTLRRLLDSESDIVVTGDFRVGDIRHNFADTELLKQKFNIIDFTNIADGLTNFCNWAKLSPIFEDKTGDALAEARKIVERYEK